MTGETDLKKLLSKIEPILVPGTFVFTTAKGDEPFVKNAKMIFHEAEATTVIIEKDKLP